VSSLFLAGIVDLSSYLPTWIAWWSGDAISILILTPLFLVWSTFSARKVLPRQIIEAVLFFFFCGLVSLIVFRGLFGLSENGGQLTYFLFLPLIWSALRFGQRVSLTVVFVLSLYAVWETVAGFGPFVGGRLSEQLLYLQSFIGVIGLTSMIMAAINDENKKLDQRKDEFIGLAGHELKTPLTSVKMLNQLLQKKLRGKVNKFSVQYLEKMDQQIDRLTELINSLLDISKIHVGQLEQHPADFSLAELIADSVETLQSTVRTHLLVVKNGIKRDRGLVYADRERINQTLINLVGNAVKYSPKGSKVIIITKMSRGEVIVAVRDFGVGIEPHSQKKIFQRYFRIGGVNEGASGLGVGLYISNQIIKANNGRMWVESEKGKGSTFYFSLPMVSVATRNNL
jgi:signal transduction histidine kinase